MSVVDVPYCASSFLMLRTIFDKNKVFSNQINTYHFCPQSNRTSVNTSIELELLLRERIDQFSSDKKIAIALSGGIDSAILAKMMPRGSVAYTFKCIVPGMSVIDESYMAAKYATECGLEHRIVEVYWEDMEAYAPVLMRHKGAPIHSIEVQIYKAAKQAKEDGSEGMVFGETADVIYGGHSGLLSRDWLVGEFIDRYSYVMPYYVLKDFRLLTEPFTRFERNGFIDVHAFNNSVYYEESINSYYNALATAGLDICLPYSNSKLGTELDLNRIRAGENKYLVRELFNRLYPGWRVPEKVPMPRPLNEWMKGWRGPEREEFWPNCVQKMSGDQRWYVYSLEQFLNIIAE